MPPPLRLTLSTSSLSVRPTHTVPRPTSAATSQLPPSTFDAVAAQVAEKGVRLLVAPQDVQGRDVAAGRAGAAGGRWRRGS